MKMDRPMLLAFSEVLKEKKAAIITLHSND